MTFTDNFNRSNENLEDSNDWERHTGSAGDVVVDSNEVAIDGFVDPEGYVLYEYVSGTVQTGVAQWAELTVGGFTEFDWSMTPMVRITSDGLGGYGLRAEVDSGGNLSDIHIDRLDEDEVEGGPLRQNIASESDPSVTPSLPFTLKIEAEGDTIRAYVNDTEVLSVVDDTWDDSNNRVGLGFISDSAFGTGYDWEAGPESGTTIEPGAVSISASTQAPTNKLTLQPSGVTLTTSVQSPAAGVLLTPAAVSLSMGVAAPNVNAADPVTLTPDAVVLTASIPTHTRTPVVLSPDAVTLTAAVQAPINRLRLRPAARSLNLSLQDTTNQISPTPAALTLSLSALEPADVFPIVLNPSAITLTATLPAADVSGPPVVIQPDALSISIAVQTPSVNTGRKPAAQTLSLSIPAPAVALTYTRDFRGVYRIPKSGIAQYELYVGTDGSPDTSGDPDETFSGFPHTTSLTLDAPGSGSTDYHLVVLRRNQYDLRADLVYERIITVNADGTTETPIDRPPHDVRLSAKSDGSIRATAIWESGDSTADQWAIWWNVDSDPDTSAAPDTTVEFPPPEGAWRRLLDTTFGEFDDGDEVHVAVGVRDSASGAQNVAAVQTITADAASGLTLESEQTMLGTQYRQEQ